MAMLQPKIAVMDETDSGLDIDALRTVAEGVNAIHTPEMGVLVITHYQRLLNYIKPDFVHVLVNGRIVKSGGTELVEQLEAEGYDPIIRELEQKQAVGAGRKEARAMAVKPQDLMRRERPTTSTASTTPRTTRSSPARGLDPRDGRRRSRR